ncbi:hypothetical protein BWR60_11090 [Inquilinus limosus]|uniref:Uncharacterized protein n=2 Tax=Inquilinus limosus TaxID=171674 RepID=A0A211ZPF9_9PROT|nr:hypothetical protein BWR60_11090 [Inquilinus limosus]
MMEGPMVILSQPLDRAADERATPCRRAEAAEERASLVCVCAVSAAGLILGLVATFGPAGSGQAVATALVAGLGGAGMVGLGIGLAAALSR